MMDEQRRITKKQLFISLLICSNFLLAGGIKNHQQVQEATALFEIWLEAQRDYHQLPGLTMAVVHDQETIWSGGYGYVNSYKQTILIEYYDTQYLFYLKIIYRDCGHAALRSRETLFR
jgi:hypothetical protein